MNRRNKAVTPTPKGTEAAEGIVLYPRQMDKVLPAHRWLLKHTELFVMWNVVSPMRSSAGGIDPARGRNGAEGMRWNKKRKVHCNGEHRGSKFALT